MVKTAEFDPSAFLDNDEVIAEYLTAALEDPNPNVFFSGVGHVAKACGMTSIAEWTSLGRESLCKAKEHGLLSLLERFPNSSGKGRLTGSEPLSSRV